MSEPKCSGHGWLICRCGGDLCFCGSDGLQCDGCEKCGWGDDDYDTGDLAMTKDRNDIGLKPFTETLLLDDFSVEPDRECGIYIDDGRAGMTVTRKKTHALYEYLKRHFEQSDRERLKRFNQFQYINAGKFKLEDECIDEFLKSEEGK